jgi:hypothetical protein
MRTISILVAAMILVGALHARRAEACGQGDGDIAGMMVVAGVYAGSTLAFAVKDIASSDHSVNYGAGEALFNGAATVLWTYGLYEDLRDPYSDHEVVKPAVVFLGLHLAMTAHGIYTMKKRRPANAPPRPYDGPPGLMQVGRVSAVVSPAPIANGGGIGLSGTF